MSTILRENPILFESIFKVIQSIAIYILQKPWTADVSIRTCHFVYKALPYSLHVLEDIK